MDCLNSLHFCDEAWREEIVHQSKRAEQILGLLPTGFPQQLMALAPQQILEGFDYSLLPFNESFRLDHKQEESPSL